MADAKKCDVCREYYDHYDSVTLESGIKMNGCKIRFTADNNICCWNNLDLCPHCMTKVHTLLSNIAYEADEKEEKKNGNGI